MKKLTILVCALLCAITALAQRPTAKKTQLPAFFASTLYVVTNNNPLSEYNEMIKEAVQKNWRVTQFDFISLAEFEQQRFDATKSFMIYSETTFPKDKNPIPFDILSIVLGGNYASVEQMPEVCSFPICVSESDGSDAYYKLPIIMSFLNQHVKTLQTNSALLKDKKYAYHVKQSGSMAKKTLYLIEEEQLPEFNTAQKIKALYKGKVVFLAQEELANLLRKRAINVAFLHKVAPLSNEIMGARCYIIFMGTDNALYHFGWHTISEKEGNGVTAKIWKTLAAKK
ncbi:MAG: hypothetical protein LBU90_04405 [Bacteroidales bacterium]|nr:hypothetical protein [Bacteroidales bacterium]